MLLAQLAIAASPPLDLSGGLGSRFAACYLLGGCLRAHGLLARVSLGVGDGLDDILRSHSCTTAWGCLASRARSSTSR